MSAAVYQAMHALQNRDLVGVSYPTNSTEGDKAYEGV
jgi:hypothetical protein